MSKTSEELLDDVAAKVSTLLLPHVAQGMADALGQRVADLLAEDWGGISVYVPKRTERRLAQRNARIYRAFTGDNVTDLAKEYGLSEVQVYTVIRAEREKRGMKQARLPM